MAERSETGLSEGGNEATRSANPPVILACYAQRAVTNSSVSTHCSLSSCSGELWGGAPDVGHSPGRAFVVEDRKRLAVHLRRATNNFVVNTERTAHHVRDEPFDADGAPAPGRRSCPPRIARPPRVHLVDDVSADLTLVEEQLERLCPQQ